MDGDDLLDKLETHTHKLKGSAVLLIEFKMKVE